MTLESIDAMAIETIERLTPKVKEYVISIEKIISEEFEYEVSATSKAEAIEIAKEKADDHGIFYGETRFSIQNCVEVNQESIEADCIDPNQINLTELRTLEHEYCSQRKEEQYK